MDYKYITQIFYFSTSNLIVVYYANTAKSTESFSDTPRGSV